jgi:hypothetical protein
MVQTVLGGFGMREPFDFATVLPVGVLVSVLAAAQQ